MANSEDGKSGPALSGLGMFSVDELFAEIQRRTDLSLLAYVDVKQYVQLKWGGGAVGAMGLAVHAKQRIYESLRDGDSEDVNEEGES